MSELKQKKNNVDISKKKKKKKIKNIAAKIVVFSMLALMIASTIIGILAI